MKRIDSGTDHDGNVLDFECSRARRTIHGLLDGDASDAAGRESLERHLVTCEACRAFRADLEAIQEAMRAMPALRFPDAALREVRERTSREAVHPAPAKWRLDWRSFAVAAVLTAAAFGLWDAWDSRRSGGGAVEPQSTRMTLEIDAERLRTDPEYARQVAEDTRRVLALTSRALRKTERAAVRGVLAGKVSTTLDRVPIDWSAGEETLTDEQAAQKRREENEI